MPGWAGKGRAADPRTGPRPAARHPWVPPLQKPGLSVALMGKPCHWEARGQSCCSELRKRCLSLSKSGWKRGSAHTHVYQALREKFCACTPLRAHTDMCVHTHALENKTSNYQGLLRPNPQFPLWRHYDVFSMSTFYFLNVETGSNFNILSTQHTYARVHGRSWSFLAHSWTTQPGLPCREGRPRR